MVAKEGILMNLLEVKKVSIHFGGLAALTDISFELKKQEILGLIGPNGAGKTTMFNIINGFYPPTTGDVYLRGQKISKLKPHAVCKLGVSRTFQVVKPLQRMSVLDNVIASAFLRKKNKVLAEETALEMLKFTNLYNDRNIVSKGLPLGKRKRLEIARALATLPEIILLDESFAGLNPTEINEQIEIVKKIRTDRGITILIIEHHMKVIMSISDRIVVLNYGQKIAEGTPNEIGHNPSVIEAYLGEEHGA
jgi:branched-chain amino acid transport system ATP-binding protein